MPRSFATLAGLIALASLAGCGDASPEKSAGAQAGAAAVTSGTLAAALSDAPGMTTVSSALKGTGLAGVFDGSAPYTMLAPDDDAFGALGEAGQTLKAPENGAAMAEVLKAHILPGYLTEADIEAALTKAEGSPVRMTTMAGSEVTFARQGEALTVTAADGATARVDGKELAASNGVALPIDAVLKNLPKSGG